MWGQFICAHLRDYIDRIFILSNPLASHQAYQNYDEFTPNIIHFFPRSLVSVSRIMPKAKLTLSSNLYRKWIDSQALKLDIY